MTPSGSPTDPLAKLLHEVHAEVEGEYGYDCDRLTARLRAAGVVTKAEVAEVRAAIYDELPEWHCLVIGQHGPDCGGIERVAVIAALDSLGETA